MDIVTLLVQKDLLKKEEAERLRKEIQTTGQKPEEILLARRKIEEDLLFGVKAEVLQMPLRSVEATEVPLKILDLIPEDSAKYYRMVPLGVKAGKFEIGMVYPEDARAQEALQFLARRGKFSYEISLIAPSTFESLMKQSRSLRRETTRALHDLEQEIGKGEGVQESKAAEVGPLKEEAPITKMVAVILRNAVEGGASDVHIEPSREGLRVRFRFLGDLHPSLVLPANVSQAIVSRLKILSNMKIDETRKPQDGRFSATIGERAIDFRVASLPTPQGEKMAIRVLDPSTGFKSFEDLGVESSNLARIKKASERPFGLILVTGPTGSGKTTTLYAVLRQLNKDTVNILSLEDPVEYFIDGVNQSQVRPEIGYDFASGLRQLLRQDPDIIMVGEVRDNETASLVIHAALTGHLVLSTLHTNSAAGVIPRLLDMGVDRFLIPATLALAIGQRLVRRLCNDCKKREKPEKGIRELLWREMQAFPAAVKKLLPPTAGKSPEELAIFQPIGCKKCGASGYTGRIAIMEALEVSDRITELVGEQASEAKISKVAQEEGMVTMRQDGIIKALDGVTTLEEVLRVTAEA
ncbi:MAG TPA: GspE/PulE family protein [Candidatus Paceibacterota bacterium]